MTKEGAKRQVARGAPLAFWLAIILLLLPLHADLLASLAHERQMGAMILCSSLCIGAVAIPALVATISYLRNPKAYIALRYLLPAYTLIALNLVVAITVRQILETQQSDSSE